MCPATRLPTQLAGYHIFGISSITQRHKKNFNASYVTPRCANNGTCCLQKERNQLEKGKHFVELAAFFCTQKLPPVEKNTRCQYAT